LGIVLFCLGYPDQALARSSAAIAEAGRLAHPPSAAYCLAFGARLHSLDEDNAALGEQAGQLIALGAEQAFPEWRGYGVIFRGWAKVKNDDLAEGISLMRSGLAALHGTGAEVGGGAEFFTLQARACALAGQIEEAVTLLDGALQIVETRGQQWFAAEANRHKGRLLQAQGHAGAAEELYHKALSIAQEQEAKLWELRAAVSLARLRCEQGRRAEAHDLAPVYGWFTEGSDTADLREARALLDELR
jgi:adenylate cyclase